MNYLKNFNRFNENISEEEMNRILDKISNSGIKSLTHEEQVKLKSFSGEFKDDSDDVSFDKDGNILVNGKPPLYKNVKDTSPESKQSKKESIPPKETTNNYSLLKSKFDSGNIITLKNDDDIFVGLDRYLSGSNRIYFISFKSIKDKKSRSSSLKLVYNMNKTNNNGYFDNFTVYDNYDNLINFSELESFLNSNSLSYETFNNAWYYIEENYINR